jgi:hypothetical protein
VPTPETDFASPEAIVAASYEAVGFAPGERPALERAGRLFWPTARLVRLVPGGVEVMTFSEWERGFLSLLAEHDLRSFWEGPTAGHADRHGDLVHVWSAYEGRLAADHPQVLLRGVNSFQLVRRAGRWWILHLTWTRVLGSGPFAPRG